LKKKARTDRPIQFSISKNRGAQFKKFLYDGAETEKAKEIWGRVVFCLCSTKASCPKNCLLQPWTKPINLRFMTLKNYRASKGSIDSHDEKDLYKIKQISLIQ
jgi:hypothetical protein